MGLLLAIAFLLLISLVPGLRRFVMWTLAIIMLGSLLIGSATDMDEREMSRFLLVWTVPWVLLFIVGAIQKAVVRSNQRQTHQAAITRSMAKPPREQPRSRPASYFPR